MKPHRQTDPASDHEPCLAPTAHVLVRHHHSYYHIHDQLRAPSIGERVVVLQRKRYLTDKPAEIERSTWHNMSMNPVMRRLDGTK